MRRRAADEGSSACANSEAHLVDGQRQQIGQAQAAPAHGGGLRVQAGACRSAAQPAPSQWGHGV